MTAPRSDDDLNRDLQSLASVTPRDVEPPAHLDDAIRAAARRSVHAKPGGSGVSWRSRSSTPLAAAAVLVLTVSIGFLSLEKPEVHDLQAPQAQFKEAAVAQTPMEMKAAAPAATVIAAAPVEAAPKQSVAKPAAAPAAKIVAPAPLRAELQRAPAPPPPAPAPALVAPPAPVAIAAAPAPPAPVAPARPLTANEIVLAPKDDARLAGLAKRERYIAPSVASEPAAATRAPAADASAELRAEPRVVASMAPAAPSQPAALKSSPPAALLQDTEAMPQLWIARIQVLKATGKLKEAEEELAKFRKRHPDYVLPEDLKVKDSASQK